MGTQASSRWSGRRKWRNVARVLAALLLVPIALYLLCAAVLSALPVNGDWREPDPAREQTVTIYVATNGVHTGLVLPSRAAGVDWSARAPASDVPDHSPAAWRMFGWGDRRFYVETPTWAEVRPGTVAGAFVGSGNTLIHVDHMRDFEPDDDIRPLRLRPDEYRRLAAFVDATFAQERERVPGYGPRDVFYAARGGYSALTTCNVWVGHALASAGVRVGRWTPMSGGVMQWVPKLR